MKCISVHTTGFTKERNFSFVVMTSMLFTLFACEKEYEWQVEPQNINTIVVEGIITNENKFQHIHLSFPATELNQIPEPVTTAQMTLSWADQSLNFVHDPTQPGNYKSQLSFPAAVDISYKLEISLDSLQYEAYTYMVPVLPAESIGFIWHPARMRYSLQWNNPQYSPIEYAMHEALIEWNHLPGWDHPDSLSQARLLFYTLGTIDVSYIIVPQQAEKIYFPIGSVVTYTKYSLTPEHGAFLRALLSETQWQGGFFETARANLPGNISNGGLGYLGASAVIRQTLVAGDYNVK